MDFLGSKETLGSNRSLAKYEKQKQCREHGDSLWPCVIVNHQHLNREEPKFAHQWVMWYGDYEISQVDYRMIFKFPSGLEEMQSKITKIKNKLFSRAFKEYYRPSRGLIETWTLKEVIERYYDPNKRLEIIGLGARQTTGVYPPVIKERLWEEYNYKPDPIERRQEYLDSESLQLALTGQVAPEAVYIACFGAEDLKEHPLFVASLCSECLISYINALLFTCSITSFDVPGCIQVQCLSYGKKGKCLFCALCGCAEKVAVCDREYCPSVFCGPCIEHVLCPGSYAYILSKKPWYCFFCNPEQIMGSLLKIREDWKSQLVSIYQLICEIETRPHFGNKGCLRKIRVLSLFDGIGTGPIVL
ncbi:hypothetical protein QAD02_022506 [Eretmocerus hayati]|uniref:Uncharacterized protein n=1 Tax=Eretmocerus hayati TaxID=131215 RepID=A0ACC2PWH6_9HYME|nr:hypothetical protein QAD02_022506 [Eretmocerus hayati]